MNISVAIKKIGKEKKGEVGLASIEIPTCHTLRDIILNVVKQTIWGKVDFWQVVDKRTFNIEDAQRIAIESFEDGLYKVFLNGNGLESLDASVQLHEGDILTFVKLTFLAGRMY